ncbi:MAG: hypothetical protein CLLPBCKN_005434 [Chroococcidiopsis cubana SAG 39.79]|jgi:hypothetical protein|uniref:DUF1817 domain-containing protein n=1 Tax=Chroococcidiopsis cubana SAG 39.79 TaxID=388085 RepID=A0AB37UM92_9CYAN|nr:MULTISPECIES: alr0857 family protein [Chroococcidiopsis]MBE9018017.1 hypothetical protein [Chroococcidiopsidales cyanobacterium LEGE 13417]PSB41997.1 hypothetical protein C7B80_28965 [Cyanosarcina cf. burmensis CCALA 770]MDZ4876014.1 hypothetical protein [Chroococcidiopsis cubana SAG 39.79]PSB60930.1 hypothetical protein C7B79_23860 [Chroococcidiopsis cubana CCALA 043]PSM45970.1 hypothetical protein C7Y66_27470 [Chroococcidiopsis sp. CCALA 051]
MLKLNYTETGFHLEHLTQSLEEWVAMRAIFALRVGESICIEPSTASFLLPGDLPQLNSLATAIERYGTDEVALEKCDAEYVEICLQGFWLASDAENAAGVFVTSLSYAIELLLFHLWQESQMSAAMSDR